MSDSDEMKDKPNGPKDPKDPKGPKDPKDPNETALGYVGYGLDLFVVDPWNPTYKSRILATPVRTGRRERNATEYLDMYEDNFLDMTHTLIVESGLKGSYGDFSGSISSKFARSERRTEKRHLQKITYSAYLYDIEISSTRAWLKQVLDPEFVRALASMDIQELFGEYGTHLINKIRMGGRAEYFCQTADIFSMTKEEFQITAQAKYKSLGGEVKGKEQTGTVDKKKEKLVLGGTSINTIGGSPDSAVGVQNADGWAKWAKTCPEKPGFLGFNKDDGLVPIWELTDNAARRREIHEAYKRKAAKAIRTQILSVTSPVASRPEARVTVPEGYKLLSGGARVNWKGRGSLLTASYPEVDRFNPAARSWVARGKDHLGEENLAKYWDSTFPDPASITVFAIALYDPDDLWEVKHLYAEKVPPSNPPYATFSREDRERYWSPSLELDISKHQGPFGPIGGGDGEMVGGGAQLVFSGSLGQLLSECYPVDGFTWRAKAESHLMFDAPTSVLTYATVLKSRVEKIQLTAMITSNESSPSKTPSATTKVAQGCVMTGGGARMVKAEIQEMLLTASFPSDIDTWEGRGKDHGRPSKGTVKVYCFGVKVTG